MTAELYTKTDQFIARIKIPDFMYPPIVINWGVRTFQLMCTRYVEVFAYTIPESINANVNQDGQMGSGNEKSVQ